MRQPGRTRLNRKRLLLLGVITVFSIFVQYSLYSTVQTLWPKKEVLEITKSAELEVNCSEWDKENWLDQGSNQSSKVILVT